MQQALADLRLVLSRLQTLDIFSENEALEDASTRNLIYMTVPFVFAEVLMNARILDRDERMKNLKQAQVRIIDTFLLHR